MLLDKVDHRIWMIVSSELGRKFLYRLFSNALISLNRCESNLCFSLPYTEACIREILRYETLVPTNVAHTAMTDTEFAGYSIPKGTLVFTIMDAAMHDPT